MNTRWSLIDLVTLSVIGISCGALFAGWNVLWGALTPIFALVLPLQYLLLAGTWVIAGPLAGLIIKRRGAALFGELIAASVSFLLASQWSIDALFSGAAQGLGAEVVFLLFGYRVWGWPVVVAAGAAALRGELGFIPPALSVRLLHLHHRLARQGWHKTLDEAIGETGQPVVTAQAQPGEVAVHKPQQGAEDGPR